MATAPPNPPSKRQRTQPPISAPLPGINPFPPIAHIHHINPIAHASALPMPSTMSFPPHFSPIPSQPLSNPSHSLPTPSHSLPNPSHPLCIPSQPLSIPSQPFSTPSQSNPFQTHPIYPIANPINPLTSSIPVTGPICLVPSCTTIAIRQGPDGPQTLCSRCYARYAAQNLPVYLCPTTNRTSVTPTPGCQRMRVIGFARRGTRMRDLSQPNLVPDEQNIQSHIVPPSHQTMPHRPKLNVPIDPKCLRPACGTTAASQWCRGPDGPCTLCNTCYARYFSLKMILYQSPDMYLSVVPREDWTPVRVIGFAKSSTGKSRDLTRPIVEPLTNSREDAELKINDLRRSPRPLAVVRRPRRSCYRMCGRVASKIGPDGVDTLCDNCGDLYITGALPVYMASDGRVSIQKAEDKIEMRVRGFEAGHAGHVDVMRPVVAPMMAGNVPDEIESVNNVDHANNVANLGKSARHVLTDQDTPGNVLVLEEGDGSRPMFDDAGRLVSNANLQCPFIDELKRDGELATSEPPVDRNSELKFVENGEARDGQGQCRTVQGRNCENEVKGNRSCETMSLKELVVPENDKNQTKENEICEAVTPHDLKVMVLCGEGAREFLLMKGTGWAVFYEQACGVWGVKEVVLLFEDDEGKQRIVSTSDDFRNMLAAVGASDVVKVRLSGNTGQ